MKIINGDCLEELKKLEDNSVDAVVTDPPYELGFMSKSWDASGISYNIDMWKECLRVLKPGGHLLSFGGSRTYHRMACAIEDAGFEIRDQIMWIYGCLSDDTEVLTKRGWKHYHKITKYDRIKIYDIKGNIYKWEIPKRWISYNINKDTAYRIRGNKTDQIVSKEHRCLVERDGKLVFKQAWELSEVELMPTLPDNFFELEAREKSVLLKTMCRKGKGLAEKVFSKWQVQKVSSERNENGKEPSVERWSNLFSQKGKLWKIQDKICEVSEKLFGYGSERRLCYGTSTISSTEAGQMSNKTGSNTPYRPQPRKQFFGKLNVIFKQQRTQTPRSTRAKVEEIEYTGKFFCPTVSTGAFVARRNGNIFITGNSGFPKSHNIGKAVDKIQGNERKVVGENPNKAGRKHNAKGEFAGSENNPKSTSEKVYLDKGNSPWEGWGTALKPAHEPIVLARKPISEKTIAENVLKWGTGGLNIDGCRVEHDEPVKKTDRKEGTGNSWNDENTGLRDNPSDIASPSQKGRFPANLITDGSEEVVSRFPNTKSGGGDKANKQPTNDSQVPPTIYGGKWEGNNGSASRFFYCAKASKGERNAGLEGFEKKQTTGGGGGIGDYKNDVNSASGKYGSEKAPAKNNHPTVKPISLMSYLVRLITPPKGIVLDPFLGSGTTGIACVQEGFDFIGIEKEREYIKIAEARIKYWQNKQAEKLL